MTGGRRRSGSAATRTRWAVPVWRRRFPSAVPTYFGRTCGARLPGSLAPVRSSILRMNSWNGTSATLLAVAATVAAARGSRGRKANYDGPPVAHTGGFGEPTCRACHQDEPLNAPGGSLRIEGLPRRYEPGRAYMLTVVLRRSGLGRAGFELSTRVADGQEAGSQAAVFVARGDPWRARARPPPLPRHEYATT